jgi:ribosomal protein L3 glutamine methyltransferase
MSPNGRYPLHHDGCNIKVGVNHRPQRPVIGLDTAAASLAVDASDLDTSHWLMKFEQPTSVNHNRDHGSQIDDLLTVRDWVRFGTSQFTRAGIVCGHGTQSALDEAAFLTLMALDLPIDQLEPWFDARLTRTERVALSELFQKRITTRTPAAYLVKAAFIQGHRFFVDERVIIPRSYIGELLGDGLAAIIDDPTTVTSVLDVCTGSGCLAILAALAFENAAIDAVELSPDALDVARRNVADYGLQHRVQLICSDLLDAIPQGKRYDLIIANPPYVAAAEVAAFDPEYKAEPVMAHAGGIDGLDLVRKILIQAADHLTPDGTLIMEIGTGRAALEASFPHFDVFWLDTTNSEGEVFAITTKALKDLQPSIERKRKR